MAGRIISVQMSEELIGRVDRAAHVIEQDRGKLTGRSEIIRHLLDQILLQIEGRPVVRVRTRTPRAA